LKLKNGLKKIFSKINILEKEKNDKIKEDIEISKLKLRKKFEFIKKN